MLSRKKRLRRLYGSYRSNRYIRKLSKIKRKFLFLDGVVLVDPEYVKDRKVYASVLAGNIEFTGEIKTTQFIFN
jgi:hypothetical protein